MQNVWYFYLNQTETDQLGNRGKKGRAVYLSENTAATRRLSVADSRLVTLTCWNWSSQSELRGKIYMQNIFLPRSNWNQLMNWCLMSSDVS